MSNNKIIKLGTTDYLEVKGETVSAVRVRLYNVAKDVNVDLLPAYVDLSKVDVKITLERNKQVTTLMNDNLQKLGHYMHYKFGWIPFAEGVTMVPKGVAVKEENYRLVYLNFDGVINLSATDILKVEITLPLNGLYDITKVDNVASYVDVSAEESDGYETHLTRIESFVVKDGEKEQSFTLGDNVTKAMLMNLDKDDYTQPVVKSMQFISNRWNFNSLFLDMVNDQYRLMDSNALENLGILRGEYPYPQTFVLFDHNATVNYLHDLKLNFQFNEDNLNKSQNYIIYSHFTQTAEQVAKASTRKATDVASDAKKIMAASKG
jgi:hypothetical protein